MRILTVREVAEILKLHPRTVTKMARNGEIPATRIGRVWRFDESAVLEWFNARLIGRATALNGSPAHSSHLWNGATRVSDLLNEDTVLYTAERKTKREVLELLAALAMRTHLVPDYERLVESLAEREEMCPTAIEGGIAFPHPRHPLDHLKRPVLAGLVAKHGVDFGAPDGLPTRVFVMVCSPDDRAHVKILSHLARVFRPSHAVQRLVRCRAPSEIIREVRHLERELIERSHAERKGVTS